MDITKNISLKEYGYIQNYNSARKMLNEYFQTKKLGKLKEFKCITKLKKALYGLDIKRPSILKQIVKDVTR
jgi:hypothetical protein